VKKRLLFVSMWLAIVAISFAISRASGFSFLATLAIVVVAMAINAAVITIEDDMPGGSENPDGSATPDYTRTVGWTLRVVALLLAVVTAITLALS